MECKAVIIRVLQRFQANVPAELRGDVAVVTRLALTGHSGRFPEDIETEASDKYKEASHRPSILHEHAPSQFFALPGLPAPCTQYGAFPLWLIAADE